MGAIIDSEIAQRLEDQRLQIEELRAIVERVGAKLRDAAQHVRELGQAKLRLQVERDHFMAEVDRQDKVIDKLQVERDAALQELEILRAAYESLRDI